MASLSRINHPCWDEACNFPIERKTLPNALRTQNLSSLGQIFILQFPVSAHYDYKWHCVSLNYAKGFPHHLQEHNTLPVIDLSRLLHLIWNRIGGRMPSNCGLFELLGLQRGF